MLCGIIYGHSKKRLLVYAKGTAHKKASKPPAPSLFPLPAVERHVHALYSSLVPNCQPPVLLSGGIFRSARISFTSCRRAYKPPGERQHERPVNS